MVEHLAPNQIKLMIANHGRASKPEVREALITQYDVRPPPGTKDDAIDALAVAIAASMFSF